MKRITVFLAAAWSASLVDPAPALAEGKCPQVLIVMDRTGSQGSKLPGSMLRKWDVAVAAMKSFVEKFQDTIRFGFNYFNSDGMCGAGVTVLDPDYGRAAAIAAQLDMLMPRGLTPTAQTFMALKGYKPLLDPAYDNYILLFTDGLPNCGDSEMTGAMSIPAIKAVADDGIKIFVLGFGLGDTPDGGAPGVGARYNEVVLNGMAEAGGIPRAVPPAKTKYYAADDPAQLAAALDEIAGAAGGGGTIGKRCLPKGAAGDGAAGDAGGPPGSGGSGDPGGQGGDQPPGGSGTDGSHGRPECACRTGAGGGSSGVAPALAAALLPAVLAAARARRRRRDRPLDLSDIR